MLIAELLSSPEKWTQVAYARDSHREPCAARSGDAQCFCLMGALERCYYESDARAYSLSYNKLGHAISRLYPDLAGMGLAYFNDHDNTTFEMVQEVIREAGV